MVFFGKKSGPPGSRRASRCDTGTDRASADYVGRRSQAGYPPGVGGETMQESGWAAEHAYRNQPHTEDMRFRQVGAFTETAYWFEDGGKIIGGLRINRHSASDSRNCVGGTAVSGICMDVSINHTLRKVDRETLLSRFSAL